MNCSSDQEKLLKFKAEGREFAKKNHSRQNNFGNKLPFLHTIMNGVFSTLFYLKSSVKKKGRVLSRQL